MGVGIAGNNTTIKLLNSVNISSGVVGSIFTVASDTFAIVTIITSGQANLTNAAGANAQIATGATSIYLGAGNGISHVSGSTHVYGAIFDNSP